MVDMSKEIWKDVGECKGYEEFAGLYEVSNYGRIRSKSRQVIDTLGRKRCVEGKLLSSHSTPNGYFIIALCNQKLHLSTHVHTLVALAFLPNPNNYPQVNHKDEDKSNNRADNLEWCTAKYNTNYGTCIKRRSKSRCTKIKQFDLQGNLLSVYKSIREAASQLQRHPQGISACLTGRQKTAYGYIWKYAD